MSAELSSFVILQPEMTPGAGDGGGGGAGAAPPGCGGGQSMIMMVVIMAVFYFMLIRPQQKRQKEHDAMLKALRKGVKVRTTGGILGEIISIDEREVVLSIADRTKINVLRSNIAGAEADPAAIKAAQEAADTKKSKDKKEPKEAEE